MLRTSMATVDWILIGLSEQGQPQQAINQSTRNYHWQVVRPHASQASGDQRINPFGIGGEMELRSGLMLQKQPINGPLLHFGLGELTTAEVVRVGLAQRHSARGV